LIEQAIFLTIKLATITTILLLVISLPLAWWLANTRHFSKPFIEAIVAIPIVLPPTVLGFYLLVLLGNNGALGQLSHYFTGHSLAFTFGGLVIASMLYSLPFVVQPLQASFDRVDKKTIEAAYLLGAYPIKVFLTIVFPQIKRGFIAACVLGFAHTVGEFGVVLMVGGNIPGETQVVSIALYELVETLEYEKAHYLSAGLLLFSFIVLLLVYGANKTRSVR